MVWMCNVLRLERVEKLQYRSPSDKSHTRNWFPDHTLQSADLAQFLHSVTSLEVEISTPQHLQCSSHALATSLAFLAPIPLPTPPPS